MTQISLYIDETTAERLHTEARLKNCSASKYVTALIRERFIKDDDEEERKKTLLRKLRGASKEFPLSEPSKIPWEAEIRRRFDLL
jgi:hypothetical protein